MNKYTQQLPFIPPSLQQMLQLGSVFSPMVQCGSTFVYLFFHSRTCLEWMRKLDVHAWNCAYLCVGGGPPLKEITQGPAMHTMGLRDPIVNLEADL